MEYEELFTILAQYSALTKREVKELPEQEIARQLILYLRGLGNDSKETILSEIYKYFPLVQEPLPQLEPDEEFIKKYHKKVIVEDNKYNIIDDLTIKKDIVLPKGTYCIKSGMHIAAENCQLVIQPGTRFLFNNKTYFEIDGGKLSAIGSESEKIEFLTARKMNSSSVKIKNSIEAVLEQFIITGLHQSYGALRIENSDVFMKNGEIKNNDSCGICIDGSCTVSMDEMKIQNNTADCFGGGISANKARRLVCRNTKIKGNTCYDRSGGGIYTTCDQTYLENCEIENNQAKSGGGIRADGIMALKNCKIIKNKSTEYGGGIRAESKAILDDNCIIEGNSKPQIYGKAEYSPSIIKDGNN